MCTTNNVSQKASIRHKKYINKYINSARIYSAIYTCTIFCRIFMLFVVHTTLNTFYFILCSCRLAAAVRCSSALWILVNIYVCKISKCKMFIPNCSSGKLVSMLSDFLALQYSKRVVQKFLCLYHVLLLQHTPQHLHTRSRSMINVRGADTTRVD